MTTTLASDEGSSESAGGGITTSATADVETAAILSAQSYCPPDMSQEVWAALPLEMQFEVLTSAGREADATALLEAEMAHSEMEREVLLALPEELRLQLVGEEVRVKRQAADNALFINSLPLELRNEVLLSADEEFLRSLPEVYRAEARQIRDRHAAQLELG